MKRFTAAICFSQYGPYHHARVRELQRLISHLNDEGTFTIKNIIPFQLAAETITYRWQFNGDKCDGLVTFCNSNDEHVSPPIIFFKTLRFIFAYDIDILFIPSYWPLRIFAVFLAAKLLAKKTVMMNESHQGTEAAKHFKKMIKNFVVRSFDSALVGGSPHLSFFTNIGIPKSKIFTGYDAIDNNFYSSAANCLRQGIYPDLRLGAQNQSLARSISCHYNLPTSYFLNLGRMVHKKNLTTLLYAYADYCRRCQELSIPPFALVFVGSGEQEPLLKELSHQLGLNVFDKSLIKSPDLLKYSDLSSLCNKDKLCPAVQYESLLAPNIDNNLPTTGEVHFYGFRQIAEHPFFYALASAFILPSIYEEWGLVVNEAMASSLPVVVSCVAGCAQDLLPALNHRDKIKFSYVCDEVCRGIPLELRQNGFAFDPNSQQSLSTALFCLDPRTCILSKTDLASMRSKSFEVVSRWGCDNFAAQAVKAALAGIK